MICTGQPKDFGKWDFGPDIVWSSGKNDNYSKHFIMRQEL